MKNITILIFGSSSTHGSGDLVPVFILAGGGNDAAFVPNPQKFRV